MNLNKLTNKNNVLLVSRGNKAILLALKKARELGYEKLFLADQGGWITYDQYAKKLKFKVIILKTERGIINFDYIEKDSVVLFNDMPSYAFIQNEFDIDKMKKKNILSIGDITGSIGSRFCNADILVCSFGEHKMINLGTGGMIASNHELNFESNFEGNIDILNEKIENLGDRLNFLRNKREIIKKDLKNKIIKYDVLGINLIMIKDEEVIKYCESNNIVYKLCPMHIKVLEPAISIEVQELE